MWQRMVLAFPATISAISCSVLTVNPWTYGAAQVTDSGNYLSPENAVKYLAKRLATAGGAPSVVSILQTGTQLDGFITSMENLAGIFPIPDFEKTIRKAKSATELAITKMQLPGAQISGLPEAAALPIRTYRQAINAAKTQAAAQAAQISSGSGEIAAALASFENAATAAQQEAGQFLGELKGKFVEVWAFIDAGEPAKVANNMLAGIPDKDAIYTAGSLFAGDIDSLIGMLKP